MKHQKPISFIPSIPILLVVIFSFIFSSCESSRVGPELPQPNPPVPPAQPLILTGFVKDLTNLSPISGVTVKIARADQTVLTTMLTDNNGKYAYDASHVPDNSLKVSATKDGYAFKGETASILKASNLASVDDILLAKLTVATTSVTVAAGGTVSTPNVQSAAGQTLTVTVPANAVSQPITLTAASIPAGQIPQPSNANVHSAAKFGPAGTTFLQPVTITFPLPSSSTPGSTFSLLQLNEQTSTYTNSGFTATVDATGTRATAPVTHFTIYALSGAVSGTLSDGAASFGSATYYSLSSGSGTKAYSSTNTYAASGGTGTVNAEWLRDIVANKLNIDFATKTFSVGGNFPALPSDKQINGVQTPPPGVSGKGNWEYRWYVVKRTTPTTGTLSGTGWSRNITVVKEKWFSDNDPTIVLPATYGAAKTGWYWYSHDQGAFVGGPY